MKIETFESWLQDKHMEDYHGTDDDSPDAYEAWVSDLQVDDLIQYAEEWGKELLADMDLELTKVIIAERNTWAKESIGDIALKSLEMAIIEKFKTKKIIAGIDFSKDLENLNNL